MNIIICGAGRVGFTIAKQLSEQGHSITVIDQSSEDIQIFDDSLFVINNHDADFQGLLEKRRQQIKTNVSLHGKYKRRLKLLNL